jgi:hypothetical protein
MTSEQDMTVIFTDQTGAHYRVPLAELQVWRVPEEQQAELGKLVAVADDVRGHLFTISFPLPLPRPDSPPLTPHDVPPGPQPLEPREPRTPPARTGRVWDA